MKNLLSQLVLSLCLVCAFAWGSPGQAVPTPQNVLLIIADDIGVEKLKAYQSDLGHTHPVASTPTINDLAATGIRFTQNWSNPTCSPTRAAILVGRHAFRHGVGVGVEGGSTAYLQPSETTLADIITTQGGKAALFGKWHLGIDAAQGGTLSPLNTGGFDRHAGGLSGRVSKYDRWTKVENGSSARSKTYATFDTAQETIDWVTGQTTPWLAVASFNAPHTPLHDPPGYNNGVVCSADSRSDDDLLCYRSMVEYMDSQIQRIIDALITDKQFDNTTVIFTGDNGSIRALAEAPFVVSKVKGTVYQGGVHVPLIISGPGVDQPGRAVSHLSHSVDLFATILELMGYGAQLATHELTTELDSDSLLPYLSDVNQTAIRSTVYTEAFAHGDPTNSSAAIRDAQYKLVRQFVGGSVAREEFYDLSTALPGQDPEAKRLRRLSAAESAALTALGSAMDALRASGGY